MPWKDQTKMQQRLEFVKFATRKDSNISELCKRYNITRKTGYKWIERFQQTGTCEEVSRKPKHSPKVTSGKIIDEIINLKQKYETWGGRKIYARLHMLGFEGIPSASAISKVLKREGFITTHPHKTVTKWKRFEHESPNDLWQMDFKGYFLMADGNKCHPLTIIDDHSRFCVCLKASPNQVGHTVQEFLTEIFTRYGLPNRINCDNGAPWGTSHDVVEHTNFSVWLMRLGVKISHSRPYHPQTNGKDERFHRTLKYDLIERTYIKNLIQAQSVFDDWLQVYNYERPHEGIGMKTPMERYKHSYRAFPKELPDIVYGDNLTTRNVDSKGYIYFEGYKFSIGCAFKKQPLGILYIDESTIDIFFCEQKLARFDVSVLNKTDAHGIYRKANKLLEI